MPWYHVWVLVIKTTFQICFYCKVYVNVKFNLIFVVKELVLGHKTCHNEFSCSHNMCVCFLFCGYNCTGEKKSWGLLEYHWLDQHVLTLAIKFTSNFTCYTCKAHLEKNQLMITKRHHQCWNTWRGGSSQWDMLVP